MLLSLTAQSSAVTVNVLSSTVSVYHMLFIFSSSPHEERHTVNCLVLVQSSGLFLPSISFLIYILLCGIQDYPTDWGTENRAKGMLSTWVPRVSIYHKPYISQHTTEKRFVKILVGPCSATRRKQEKSRSLAISCLCLLFGLLTGLQEIIYSLLCTEAPTASQTPIGLINMAWGKCAPNPKSDVCFMHQVGAPAHPAWFPWYYSRQCLLLQKEARRNYLKSKTNWEPSLLSKKREKKSFVSAGGQQKHEALY